MGLFFVNVDNNSVVSSFFNQIGKYTSYITQPDLTILTGEVFLATIICLSFILVSSTAKNLDNNSKKVFTVNVNMFSIIILIFTAVFLIKDSSY